MPKGVWIDGRGFVPFDPVSTPASEPPKPAPAPVEEPEDTTLVDEHPPVADEPHGSDDSREEHPAEEAHNDEHEEDHGMTEDEINETPTEEPKEFWSVKRVAIGVGVVLLLFVIAVSAASRHPYVLGLLSLGFLGSFGFCGLKAIRGKGATNRLAFVVVAILSFIFMVICWVAMAKGSAPVGPYDGT